MEALLELVALETNIHEIIWRCPEEDWGFEGPVEGRYWHSLGYPIFLTNASGYMSPILKNGIYTFVDGIEDVLLPKTSHRALRELLPIILDLEHDMVVIRQLCATIFKERKLQDVPIKQALQSVTILGTNNEKMHRENPTINDYFNIELDTKLTPVLENEGRARNICRSIQAARKNVVEISDWINVYLPNWPTDYGEYIKNEVRARTLIQSGEFRVEKTT